MLADANERNLLRRGPGGKALDRLAACFRTREVFEARLDHFRDLAWGHAPLGGALDAGEDRRDPEVAGAGVHRRQLGEDRDARSLEADLFERLAQGGFAGGG